MSRLIDADALVPDFLVTTPANNTPCKRYVSMEQIHDAPTIEPERTGKWIRFKDEDGYYHIKCSECGQYWSVDRHAKIFKYCFNCEARMEVEE